MYAHTHTCTCTLKAVKLWGNKAPHKNHRLTNSVPEIKPLQAWGVLSKGLPKQYWLPMQPTFGCHSRVEGWTTAEDTTHEDIWPRKPLCHDSENTTKTIKEGKQLFSSVQQQQWGSTTGTNTAGYAKEQGGQSHGGGNQQCLTGTSQLPGLLRSWTLENTYYCHSARSA